MSETHDEKMEQENVCMVGLLKLICILLYISMVNNTKGGSVCD